MHTRREFLKAHQDLATSIEIFSLLHPEIRVSRSASAYFLNTYFCNHLMTTVRFALRVHYLNERANQLRMFPKLELEDEA